MLGKVHLFLGQNCTTWMKERPNQEHRLPWSSGGNQLPSQGPSPRPGRSWQPSSIFPLRSPPSPPSPQTFPLSSFWLTSYWDDPSDIVTQTGATLQSLSSPPSHRWWTIQDFQRFRFRQIDMNCSPDSSLSPGLGDCRLCRPNNLSCPSDCFDCSCNFHSE